MHTPHATVPVEFVWRLAPEWCSSKAKQRSLTFILCCAGLIGLAFDTQIHNVITANGAIVLVVCRDVSGRSWCESARQQLTTTMSRAAIQQTLISRLYYFLSAVHSPHAQSATAFHFLTSNRLVAAPAVPGSTSMFSGWHSTRSVQA